MKVVLQAFEPLHQPFGNVAEVRPAASKVRKSSLRLMPVVPDFRLFHAWRA